MKPVNTTQHIESAPTPAVAPLLAARGMTGALAPKLQALKRRAAAIAQNHLGEASRADQTLSPAQAQKALYELRVHQIELEMQNEELRQTQLELDKQRERYFDLYDLAPVGYCTVSAKGLILEANLTAASLLGVSRSELVKQALSRFVEKTLQDDYYLHCKQLLETGQPQSYELRIVPGAGAPFWARLTATMGQSDGADVMRIVLSDISELKQGEIALKQSEQRLRASEEQMVIAQKISGTGSWTYNVATREVWGSAGGMAIFGFPPIAGNFPIDRFEACVVERDRQRVHQSLMALIQTGSAYDIEFTVKPADGSPERLTHSVGTLESNDQGKPLMILGFVQDITKARLLEEQVRLLAFYDPLTALPNRRLLLDRMGQAVQVAQRSSCYGALMFLDLDNFKPLNDLHGHAAGDLLLLEVARRLNQCVRAMDTVARIGGDEFVVLLGGLTGHQTESVEQARKLAEKIRIALAEPYSLQVHIGMQAVEHRCSASIGVVLFDKAHQSLEGLLKWADTAMYRSKEEGRNRVTFMIERRKHQRPHSGQ